MKTAHKTVASKDGTTIAYEKYGSGPALVLVGAALSDHADAAKLAKRLARKFTVINYDRRGRGQSSDTPPYAVEREVEDIAALIDAAGGAAFLFGSSSGAVLALEAGSRLGAKVRGLFLYEPPFIVDSSRPPMPADLVEEIESLVTANRRSEAVGRFFRKGMGIPAIFVTMMRWLMPGWSKAAGMAHTLPYDFAVLAGTQSGEPLPAQRWISTQAPTLIMVGSKSETFFHNGARALNDILPQAQYRALEGRDHSAVQMAPNAIALAVEGFFLPKNSQAYEQLDEIPEDMNKKGREN
jgi:pimeloyl-ACP methyl ester carboxylesterase